MAAATRNKVVCFDLGGVIVRICRNWAEACGHAELPTRKPERLDSAEWRARRKELVDRYQRGELECSAYQAALSQSLDGLYSTQEVTRIHDVWTLGEYPGAFELITALNRLANVTTACLSNTNHAHWQRLVGVNGGNEYPSVRALRHQLASHLLGCLKPEASIYELAHAQFSQPGALAAEDIIFFDDLAENVLAARASGWTAFLIDHEGDTVGQIREHLGSVGIHA